MKRYRITVLLLVFLTLILGEDKINECGECKFDSCQQGNQTEQCERGWMYDSCHCCRVCILDEGEVCSLADHGLNGFCRHGFECKPHMESETHGHRSSRETDDYSNDHHSIDDNEIGICVIRDECRGFKCPQSEEWNCRSNEIKLSDMTIYSCCEIPKRCQAEKTTDCEDKSTGKIYQSGNSWARPECESCTCHDGIVTCHKSSCTKDCSTPDCNKKDGEKPCLINGKEIGHRENWKPDDCQHCECVDGVENCITTHCQSCTHPILVDGRCCPLCAEIEQNLTCDMWEKSSNEVIFVLSNCNKHCECSGNEVKCVKIDCESMDCQLLKFLNVTCCHNCSSKGTHDDSHVSRHGSPSLSSSSEYRSSILIIAIIGSLILLLTVILAVILVHNSFFTKHRSVKKFTFCRATNDSPLQMAYHRAVYSQVVTCDNEKKSLSDSIVI